MKRIIAPIIILILLATSIIPIIVHAAVEPAPPVLLLPVTIRDFHGLGWGNPGKDGYYGHPDFENAIRSEYDPGIVRSTLGVDKKPVYAENINKPLPCFDTPYHWCKMYYSTHGKEKFDMWYRDTPNYNMRKDDALTLTWDGSKYVYYNKKFFPIDNQLLGNDGRTHNYDFTLELHTVFSYKGGEIFRFSSDDDMWVFINNQLVVDLGGCHGENEPSIFPRWDPAVELDKLGLKKGENFDFDLFFAENHTTDSVFRMEIIPATTFQPVALDESYYVTTEDAVLNETPPGVLDNDSYSLMAVKASNPNNGKLVFNTNGSFSYTPNAYFYGTDKFTYRAYDGTNYSNIATVRITVIPKIRPVGYRYAQPAPGYSLSGTILDSWMNVRIKNGSPEDIFNVRATISKCPANVTIIHGKVNIGNIPKSATAWSTDTYRIETDMTKPSDPNACIYWKIEYDDFAGNHHVIENVPQ